MLKVACLRLRVWWGTWNNPRMPITSPEPLLQSEFVLPDQATSDTFFASRLIAQMQRELAQRKRHMMRVASKWLVAYDYVKMLEEQHLMTTNPVEAQSQFFKGTLSVVHGLGVLLLAKLDAAEADNLTSLGITYQDLAACVDELADISRAQDNDMTPAMVTEMNRTLFGGGHA